MKRIEEQLVLHEGIRLRPYLDTEDNWTIGVGYNISARGLEFFERIIGRSMPDTITDAEALKVLSADIDRVEQAVRMHFPEYDALNEARQHVVLDMAFNLGFRALGFTKTIAAIKRRDWSLAAKELYRSKWAHQVGDGEGGKFDRADRLSRMLLTGKDYIDPT